MQKKLLQGFSVLAIVLASSLPANAISFISSEKTKQTALTFNIDANSPLPFNLQFLGGVGFNPFYSSLVGNLSGNNTEVSLLFTGDANLGYNFKILDAETPVGSFTPTLTPYVGYKHYLTYTAGGSLSRSGISASTVSSNTSGINFGLRFSSNLPLGFFVHADGGATKLIGGAWSESNNQKGNIDVGGSLLPYIGVGASWDVFKIITLRAGYKLLFIPDLRKPLSPLDTITNQPMHSLDVGLSFLFLSI